MIRTEDTMSAHTYLKDVFSVQVLGWLGGWNAHLPTGRLYASS